MMMTTATMNIDFVDIIMALNFFNGELCPLAAWTSGRRSNSFQTFTSHRPSSTSPPPSQQDVAEKKEEATVGGGEERIIYEARGEELRALNWTIWIGEKSCIEFGQKQNSLFIV